MVYGYHRTSTTDQHLDRGIKSIEDYCKSNNIVLNDMFTDQQTGKNFDRPDYTVLKRVAKNKGDMIIISELDRLGRNKEDTLKELRHYKDLGVRMMILEIPTTLVDYSSMDNSLASMIMETINNMLIEMYATFAHAEMLKREKRQREGIDAKKARGEWEDYGRPPILSTDKELDEFCAAYKKLCLQGLAKTEIADRLKMKKTSFYKYRKMCLDREFPIMYAQLKRGEISVNDIIDNLRLRDDEYNHYVAENTPKTDEPFNAVMPRSVIAKGIDVIQSVTPSFAQLEPPSIDDADVLSVSQFELHTELFDDTSVDKVTTSISSVPGASFN